MNFVIVNLSLSRVFAYINPYWNMLFWTVYFHYAKSKLQTTVTVLKGHSISVDAPKGMLTNVPYPAKGYNFSVKFRFVYYNL